MKEITSQSFKRQNGYTWVWKEGEEGIYTVRFA